MFADISLVDTAKFNFIISGKEFTMSPIEFTRRQFVRTAGAAAAGTFLVYPTVPFTGRSKRSGKMKVALVGTGVRGVRMFGHDLVRDYAEFIELVGICDINPGRLRYAGEFIGAGSPRFTSLDEMLQVTNPEWLIVTSWDREHHTHIVTGLKNGCNIICEKPITIDEQKAQMILDAEKQYGKKIVVTLNYRYAPHRARLKELLLKKVIGDITTVDFHWNINHPHLQRYMQRWHGESEKSGSLWVHKCTHHFDLVNWWLDSEPVEVFAYASLDKFGRKGPYRGRNCRDCAHTSTCEYYWDITEDDHLKRLYVDNEDFDGYIRDNCVFRNEIDIYEKHAAMVKYANNVYLNYSLTGDSDYEGFWIAFNGTEGRIEGREGGWPAGKDYHEWIIMPRGGTPEILKVPFEEGGHWGGDRVLMDSLFRNPEGEDPLGLRAGTRDGVLSILVGIGAKKSIETGKPVLIEGLTEIKPMIKRP